MKKWTTVEADESLVAEIANEHGIPQAIATLLVSRGVVTREEIDLYLKPRLSKLSDPFELPNMDTAVERIAKAIENSERIVVYGDYDVDGITSTALLLTVLRKLGADAAHFLPHRVDDGYGLSADAVAKCIEQSDPKLIVTVDCGTMSVDAVKEAANAGIDVVVTDHHEASGEIAPATAVVNPKLGESEDLKRLAGVGVAFKLCHALEKSSRDNGKAGKEHLDLREHLDWVALGTVCDMVPLRGENRILVRHGLEQFKVTTCIGLQALIDVAGVKGEIDCYHLGYLLGPRLNASGRLGDAEAALELLLTQDIARAREIAMQLDRTNRERREIESRTVDQACEIIDAYFKPEEHFGLVVAGEGWHPGVVGIVASRLVAKYRRPTVVIAIDEEGKGKGSCRSMELFNMVEGLGQCAELLTKWGGHAMAAGLSLNAEQIDAFRTRFNEVAREVLDGEDLRAEQFIDAWLKLSEVDQGLFDAQQSLRPFGLENRRPVWGVREVKLAGPVKVLKQKHLRFSITDGRSELGGIAFGLAERGLPEGSMDVAFCLQLNAFRGSETLEMMVKDVRAAVGGDS